jgi:hypothetical protein
MTAVAFAGISLMSACGDSTGPDGDVYVLYSIDAGGGAELLPIVIEDFDVAGDVYTVKGGTLVLNNGKYTVRLTDTYKAPGEDLLTFTYGENGTYEEDGNEITLTSTHDFEDGELFETDTPVVTTAVKDGDTITAEIYDVDSDSFFTFVFKKK